jgi:superoxide dismutase
MHYSQALLTYTNNLNNAIAGTEYENQSIENILSKLDLNNSDLRNNAGGYYNHSCIGNLWLQTPDRAHVGCCDIKRFWFV